jgi:hypothetical protein
MISYAANPCHSDQAHDREGAGAALGPALRARPKSLVAVAVADAARIVRGSVSR